jgi:hypothetical protein
LKRAEQRAQKEANRTHKDVGIAAFDGQMWLENVWTKEPQKEN